MDVKCIIIDDEPLGIQVIKTHLEQVEGISLLASFQNPLKAFEYIKQHSVDLIFLDIEMPFLNGIEFLRSIENPPKVIFTTAYRNYAVESYELEAFDYLLKPISFPRFFKSVNKLKSSLKEKKSDVQSIQERITQNDHIYVNANKKYIKILFKEILYVESVKDYVRIHLKDQSVVTKGTITHFSEALPNNFLRTHRSYIVNANKITAFTSLDVEIDQKEIPIGASYKDEILHFLKR